MKRYQKHELQNMEFSKILWREYHAPAFSENPLKVIHYGEVWWVPKTLYAQLTINDVFLQVLDWVTLSIT